MATTIAHTTPTASPRPPQDGMPRRRGLASRISPGLALVLAAGLIAGIANFAVLRGADQRIVVVTAARDLAAGVPILPEDLGTTRIGLTAAGDVGLLPAEDLGRLLGSVPANDIAAGTALRPGDVVDGAAVGGLRAMSLALERARAAAGAITIGDRVDVLATLDGASHYLLADVGVLAVSGSDSLALGGSSNAFSVTLAVDAEAARCLATGQAVAEITLVLATGTEAIVADGCEVLTPKAEP